METLQSIGIIFGAIVTLILAGLTLLAFVFIRMYVAYKKRISAGPLKPIPKPKPRLKSRNIFVVSRARCI